MRTVMSAFQGVFVAFLCITSVENGTNLRFRYDIAIMGKAAVGKSTFINNIRGKKRGDAWYARIGIGGTTTRPEIYHLYAGRHVDIYIWDTPGLGTPDFQLSRSLLNEWNCDSFDMVLIFYATSIHTTELDIAEILVRKNKKIAFVRTKIDELLHSDHEIEMYQNIDKIKYDARKILRWYGMSDDIPIFAITNRYAKVGDHCSLMKFIFDKSSFSQFEIDQFLLPKCGVTKVLLHYRKYTYIINAWKVSLIAAFVVILPLRVLHFVIYGILLNYYLCSFLEIFSFEDSWMFILDSGLKLMVFQSFKLTFVANIRFIVPALLNLVSERVGKLLDRVINLPLVGTLIASATTYHACLYTLEHMLNIVSDEAWIIYNKYY